MANTDYKPSGGGGLFTPLAELAEGVDYLDTTFKLKGYSVPSQQDLIDGLAGLIDDEIVIVTKFEAGQCQVKRGAADTVPNKHAADAVIWFFSASVGRDPKEHAGGDQLSVKVQPSTIGGGTLPIKSSPPNGVTMNWRFYRPYAPGQMQADGHPWFQPSTLTSSDPNLTLTWAHRDRAMQADKLFDHSVGNIGPEPGTTYTARIFKGDPINGDIRRTEVGITGNAWNYQWAQALTDLGAAGDPDAGETVDGGIIFTSTRDNFDSWQWYTIFFKLDTQGSFLRVAQFSQMVAQNSPTDADTVGPNSAVYAAQLALMAAQQPGAETPGSGDVITAGIYVAGLSATGGQLTSFYTPINRNLFEAPYTWLRRLGIDGGAAENAGRIVTVAARPSDRLTDTHIVRSRFNYPKGTGVTLPFNTAAAPAFTPWATIKFTLQYLERTATIATSSFFDGVPISGVTIGSMALIGAEVVRVAGISEFTITLDRGCADTVPQKHNANSRIWFFEAMSGNDPFGYPWIALPEPGGSSVEVKMVPAVYGPPLLDADVPTDVLDFNRRALRPLPPGRVVVNGRPWFEGAITQPDSGVMITWASRNRVEQDTSIFDHTSAPIPGEAGQQHKLTMTVWVPSRVRGVPPTKVTVREILIDGDSYNYTYEQAQADGYKVGRLLGVCGYVSCDLYLAATRDGLDSWQGYSILLRLPSYPCAPGQIPGGGQGPGVPGGGNGQPGGDPNNPNPGDDTGAPDPIDNGGNGDNGNGPPKPPDPPPDWPDPVDPPPQDDPEDPNPTLAAHWDTNWDRHWDAYREDNTGGQ